MDLPQKYAYAVWEHKSFTQAAKALFVSQPSLSSTVAKLEQELGFKIFDRSTHPISLTTKGTVYINFLQETSELESMLAHQLRATDDLSAGKVTIGCRMSAGYTIFPIVCGELSRKYPKVSIIVDNDSTEEKLKMRFRCSRSGYTLPSIKGIPRHRNWLPMRYPIRTLCTRG